VAPFITSFAQIIVDMYSQLGSDREQVFSPRGSHLGMKAVLTTLSVGKIKSATVKPMEQVCLPHAKGGVISLLISSFGVDLRISGAWIPITACFRVMTHSTSGAS
jgi:hypothetical protein